MYRFSSPLRPLLSLMASATLRWWPPAFARRVFPPMVCPNLPVRGVSRFLPDEPLNMATISGVKGDKSRKPYIGASISPDNVIIISQDSKHSAAIQGMKNIDASVASEVLYAKPDTLGQIVKHTPFKKKIVKHTPFQKKIVKHTPFQKEIVKHTDCGEEDQTRAMDSHRREILASDDRNVSEDEGYTVNNVLRKSRHRDGSIYRGMGTRWKKDFCIATAMRGSLIYMAGPKRGIEMLDLTLIEYDLRVKTGQEEKDDLQLIDGASIIGPAGKWNEPFTICIPGDYGAVEITLSRLECAVEATVEVLISEVQSSFDLSLSCLTSELNKGIWLFDGAIAKSCSLKRSVVAVEMDSLIDLKFKLGSLSSSPDQHYCSSKAKTHGHDTQEIKTALALISVRVTWSTLPSGLG